MDSRAVGIGLGGVLLLAAGAMVVGGGDDEPVGSSAPSSTGQAQAVVRAAGGTAAASASQSVAGGEVLGSRGDARGASERGFAAGDFDRPLRAPTPAWGKQAEQGVDEEPAVGRRSEQDSRTTGDRSASNSRSSTNNRRNNIGRRATQPQNTQAGTSARIGNAPSATRTRTNAALADRIAARSATGVTAARSPVAAGASAGAGEGSALNLPPGIPSSVAAQVQQILSGGSLGAGASSSGSSAGSSAVGGTAGAGGDSANSSTAGGGGSVTNNGDVGTSSGIPLEVLQEIAGILGISIEQVEALVGGGGTAQPGDTVNDSGNDTAGSDSDSGSSTADRAASLGIPLSVLEEVAGILGISLEGVLDLIEGSSGGDGDPTDSDSGTDGGDDPDVTDGTGDPSNPFDDPFDDPDSDPGDDPIGDPGDDTSDDSIDDPGGDDSGDDSSDDPTDPVDGADFGLVWVSIDNGGCVSTAFDFDLSNGAETFDLYFAMPEPDTVLAVLSGFGGFEPVTFSGGAVLQHPAGLSEMPLQVQIDADPCIVFDSWVGIGDVDISFLEAPDIADFGGEFVAGWLDFSAQGATGQQAISFFGDERFYVRLMRLTIEPGTVVGGELQVGLELFGGGTATVELPMPAFP